MQHRSLTLALALSSLALVGSAQASEKFADETLITKSRLKAHLEFIASDELEGRGTPSRGLDTAARYLASQLSLWGIKPGGENGTYFQDMPIRRPSVDAAKSSFGFGGTELKYGDDFYGRSGGKAEGQIAYVGYGWHRAGAVDDPYKDIDVKGKVLLTLDGRPASVRFEDIRNGLVIGPLEAARKLGAIGVITVSGEGQERFIELGKRTLEPQGGEPVMPNEQGGPSLPQVVVKPEGLRNLLVGEEATAEELGRRLGAKEPGKSFAVVQGKVARISVSMSDNIINSKNVIAIIPGTDPKLKSEYVAIGAHYDHLGMRERGEGDRIYNGADDDGSGTVSVLEIAHAFAMGKRPKRSLIFVWHCGEERGLWGSDYFVQKPTVPIKSIVAQLNIDMIGRSRPVGDTDNRNKMLAGPNMIYLVGTTRMSTDLGKWAVDVNKRLYGLQYDFTYDDLNHPERIFYRSDHFNYAQMGIPILFWFDGVHVDYHRVTDTVDKIDFPKMEKIARTVYATAWEIGNKPARPRVDKPLK